MKGIKYDSDKLRWELLPLDVIEEVVKVLSYGARKYSDDNWKNVKPFKERYYSALMRHLAAWRRGEKTDPDTGQNPISHALCCLIFLAWGELHPDENEQPLTSEEITALRTLLNAYKHGGIQ